MLLHFLYPLHFQHSFFNVFKYISFGTFGAAITAVVLCMLVGPAFIRFLQAKQIGQTIRDDGPKSHLNKKGTPTMGGGLILLGIVVPTLLWADLTNKNITGKEAEIALDVAGICCNKNMIPYDTRSPFNPSGIRLGTPAITTRGFREEDANQVGEWISKVISDPSNETLKKQINRDVQELCSAHRIYAGLTPQ